MPHPLRTLVVAALASLLLVATPTVVQAERVGRPATTTAPRGFTHTEARQVLRHARHLMRQGPETSAVRPGPDLTMALRDLHLARPSLSGADLRAANRLLSRSTPAAKAQATSADASLTLRCSTHFCLHYGSTTTSSWATTTLNTLEHVWSVEVPMMGRAPLSDDGSANPDETNPDDRVDVFLEDLGDDGYYGYCTTDDQSARTQVSAYCVLDDDFARSQYGARPLSSLRVTAAHEFFHAIQFAADVSEDTWFMEGSATWAEDFVYDDINDNYQYLSTSPITHPRTSLDYPAGTFPYGSFIFFSYATARKGTDVVRQFWDEAVGRRTSLQAVYAVVGAAAWPAFFTTFGSWNTLPLHSYEERAGYPPPHWWVRKTLTPRARTTGWHSVGISHLGSAAVLAAPGAGVGANKRLLVEVDAPPRSAGSTALLQRRFRDGHVTHTMLTLGANGNARTLVQFNRSVLTGIAVVVANSDRYGPARVFKVRTSVR